VRRVEFHPAAREEFMSAADYYDVRVSGLGSKYISHVERIVRQIQRYHDIGRPFTSRVRRVLVPEFPFAVIYRLEPDRIFILAVMHLKRRPGYWSPRSAE
jgi:toxin ParE1/3/4